MHSYLTFTDIALLQIQHAGEGGLYAELIQDRSFSGLAYTQVLHTPLIDPNGPP